MTIKTGVKISVAYTPAQHKITETYTVKLDSQGFPYVIFENKKIIIGYTDFPCKQYWIQGLWEVDLDIIQGLDELKAILANPELTVDKLPISILSYS